MLISPGATPTSDLYLFIALVVLVEVAVFAGKRVKHKAGTANAQSVLSKWFAPAPVCQFCNPEIQENVNYCPSCKRFLG